MQPTSLQLAVESGDWSTVFTAKRSGTPWIELRTRMGADALLKAISDANPHAVGQLLQLGAPVRTTSVGGLELSFLWAAIENEQPEIVKLLLLAGADPMELNTQGCSLLQHASLFPACYLQPQTTLHLCTHGASPNVVWKGLTPLGSWIDNLLVNEQDLIQSKEQAKRRREEALAATESLVGAGGHLNMHPHDILDTLAHSMEAWPAEEKPRIGRCLRLLRERKINALEHSGGQSEKSPRF